MGGLIDKDGDVTVVYTMIEALTLVIEPEKIDMFQSGTYVS